MSPELKELLKTMQTVAANFGYGRVALNLDLAVTVSRVKPDLLNQAANIATEAGDMAMAEKLRAEAQKMA